MVRDQLLLPAKPTCILIQALSAPLPNQLPVNKPGKTAADESSTWAPATLTADLNGISGS